MRIFDFVGFFCSRRSWHHGIWRPGRSKRGRQYSIGEAVGMHQPKTAGCSQPYAVGSGHPALRSIHAAQNVQDSSFHPFKSRAAEPARLGPTLCARTAHTHCTGTPCTQTDGLAGNVACCPCCCHVAATVLYPLLFLPTPGLSLFLR